MSATRSFPTNSEMPAAPGIRLLGADDNRTGDVPVEQFLLKEEVPSLKQDIENIASAAGERSGEISGSVSGETSGRIAGREGGRETGYIAGREGAEEVINPALVEINNAIDYVNGSLSVSYAFETKAAFDQSTVALPQAATIYGDTNPSLNGVWSRANGQDIKISDYTVPAIGNRLFPIEDKTGSLYNVEPFLVNGRLFQPTKIAKPSGYVLEGTYLDNGEKYPISDNNLTPAINSLKDKTISLLEVNPFLVNGRPFQALTIAKPSGYVMKGIYLDNGEEYPKIVSQSDQDIQLLKDKTITILDVNPFLVNGRLFQPLEIAKPSGAVIRGIFLDNGEEYPKRASGGETAALLPNVVIQVNSATEFFVHMRGQNRESKKYIALLFRNLTNVAMNSDVWRCHGGYETERRDNGTFIIGQRFSGNGEWEFAVKIKPADDFVGGNAHGNEEKSYVRMILDGMLLPLVPGIYEGQTFEMFQKSTAFRPHPTNREIMFPKGDPILDRVCHWILNSPLGSGPQMIVEQNVTWLDTLVNDRCYLGMFKNDIIYNGDFLFNKISRDLDWIERHPDDAFLNTSSICNVYELRSDVGISVQMRVTNGWDQPKRRSIYNNGVDKVYQDFFGTDVTVPNGTFMQSACLWKFRTAN